MAISKPPYLTAIALWKKYGTFGGGGLFETTRKIHLNHRKDDVKVDDPSQIKDSSFGSKQMTFYKRDVSST